MHDRTWAGGGGQILPPSSPSPGGVPKKEVYVYKRVHGSSLFFRCMVLFVWFACLVSIICVVVY